MHIALPFWAMIFPWLAIPSRDRRPKGGAK